MRKKYLLSSGKHIIEKIGSASLALDFVNNVNILTKQAIGSAITTTRASTGYYTTDNGELISFPTNTPRIGKRGLLVETARTNLTLQSQTFANAVWDKTSLVTVTDNTNAAPDRTTTAATLSEAAGIGSHHIHDLVGSFIPTVSSVYAMSVYIKRPPTSAARYAQLSFWSAGFGVDAYVNFDLQTGTVGTAGIAIASSGIESLANGWFRIYATAPATVALASGFQLAFVTSTSAARTESYTVTGGSELSFYIWGAQVELGTYPLSYIPTTAAAATRAADDIVPANFSTWFSNTAFTMYGKGATPNTLAPLFSLDDTTASNRTRIGYNTALQARAPVLTAGILVADLYPNGNPVKNKHAISAGMTTNYAQAFSDGGTAVLDTVLTVPVLTQAKIGAANSVANNFDGYIEEIAFFPRLLSDSEQKYLTSAGLQA